MSHDYFFRNRGSGSNPPAVAAAAPAPKAQRANSKRKAKQGAGPQEEESADEPAAKASRQSMEPDSLAALAQVVAAVVDAESSGARASNIASLSESSGSEDQSASSGGSSSSSNSSAAAAAASNPLPAGQIAQQGAPLPHSSQSHVAPLSGSPLSTDLNGACSSSGSSNNNSSNAAAFAPLAADKQIATFSDSPVSGIRIVAQRDEQGRAHGFGCELDAKGKAIDDRCGVWSHGLLLEHRSVPLALMPAGLFSGIRARGAVLLDADGSWYRGAVDERYRAHGQGSWFERFGFITVERSGRFDHGSLAEGTLHYPNGVKYEGQLLNKVAHGHGTLSHSRECEWSHDKPVSDYDAPVPDSLKRSSTVAAASAADSAVAPAATSTASASFASSMRMDEEDEKTLDEPTAEVSYVGELDPLDLPHGFGCKLDADGHMMEEKCGEWIHGSFAFEGALPLSLMPPELFEKERARGVALLCANGDEYRGELDADCRPHGEGRWFTVDGELREKGTFDHGSLTNGFRGWLNDDTYEGEWKDGKRQGEGTFICCSTGQIDEGIWRDDQIVCGKRTYPASIDPSTFAADEDGSLSEGCFLDEHQSAPAEPSAEERDAQDDLFDPDVFEPPVPDDTQTASISENSGQNQYCDTYEGQFANGARCGLGVLRGPDRSILHCGEWAEDELIRSRSVPRSDLPAGSLPHPDDSLLDPKVDPKGRTFRGPLNEHNQPHGLGAMYRSDGTEQARGTWVNGVLDGPACVQALPNGDRYSGGIRRGKREGVGKYACASSDNHYEGCFSNDNKHGIGKFTWSNGDTYEGQFANDKRSGFGVLRSGEGKIRYCGEWAQNKLIRKCPVPRSALPAGALPHPDDTLLFPDGRTERDLDVAAPMEIES